MKTNTYTLKANNLMTEARAIGLYFTGFLLGEAPMNTVYGFKLKEILVRGRLKQQAQMKLTNTYAAGSKNTLVAPLSYAKLVDSTTGKHKWGLLDIGPATRTVALNFAWLQLLQSLALAQARTYEINNQDLDNYGFPIVGETVAIDSFAGVVDSVEIAYEGGYRRCEFRLINYDTSIFGAS